MKSRRTWRFWVSVGAGVPLILLEYVFGVIAETMHDLSRWCDKASRAAFEWSNKP